MGIIITIFLIGLIAGVREYHKSHDPEMASINICGGLMLALFFLIPAFALTNTNCDEYYTYIPTEIELSTIDGKAIALDVAQIYYIGDNKVHRIDTGHAYIKQGDTPRAIQYKYCGFNKENWFRWLYTFPSGADYIEFYIPDGSISTSYHFGDN